MKRDLFRTGYCPRRGRRKGVNVRSQGLILKCLEEGSKCWGELVEASGLHKNTVGRNVWVLVLIGAVVKKRIGRRVVYSQGEHARLRWLMFLCLSGNHEAKRLMRKVFELFKVMIKYVEEKAKPIASLVSSIQKYGPDVRVYGKEQVWNAVTFERERQYAEMAREYRRIAGLFVFPEDKRLRREEEEFWRLAEDFNKALKEYEKIGINPPVLYLEFVAMFFPEIVRFAEEHPANKGITLEEWMEFEELLSRIRDESWLKKWREIVEKEIDRMRGEVSEAMKKI